MAMKNLLKEDNIKKALDEFKGEFGNIHTFCLKMLFGVQTSCTIVPFFVVDFCQFVKCFYKLRPASQQV